MSLNKQIFFSQNIAETSVQGGFGLIYNNYALKKPDFMPDDWAVPESIDFTWLRIYLGISNTILGAALKEIGTTYWQSPNTGAYDQVGFKLRGGGFRAANGDFDELFQGGYMAYRSDVNSRAQNGDYNSSGITDNGVDQRVGYTVRGIYTGATTPSSTITDYDNNVYDVIEVGDGDQYWLGQNWKCTKLKDGTPLTKVTGDAAWEALSTEGYCAYDNDDGRI